MKLKENVKYSIEIESYHINALLTLMLKLEKAIRTSGLSNNISISLDCKENKELILELLQSFNEEAVFEEANILSDTHQTKELD